jgi:hypothetical protein
MHNEGRSINKKQIKWGREESPRTQETYNINLALLLYHLFRQFIITTNLCISVEVSLVDPTARVT